MTSTDVGLITAAAVQAVATIVLVGVTISYAMFTKKQAAANVKMAEEMSKQTDGDYKPILKLETTLVLYENRTQHMQINIKNVGRGPALHTTLKLVHPRFDFEGRLPDIAIETGEKISLNLDPKHENSESSISPEVIARYQNIYGKRYSTRLTYNLEGPHLEYTEEDQ